MGPSPFKPWNLVRFSADWGVVAAEASRLFHFGLAGSLVPAQNGTKQKSVGLYPFSQLREKLAFIERPLVSDFISFKSPP